MTVEGDITIDNNGCLTIPEKATLTAEGDVDVVGALTLNGDMTVEGTITFVKGDENGANSALAVTGTGSIGTGKYAATATATPGGTGITNFDDWSTVTVPSAP